MGGSKPSSLKTIRNSMKPNPSVDELAIGGWFYVKIRINVFPQVKEKWELSKNKKIP